MASTTCELVWIIGLLKDMGTKLDGPASMFCDNQAALHIVSNPMYHERTKHIEIDCHLVRKKIMADVIKTMHIPISYLPTTC